MVRLVHFLAAVSQLLKDICMSWLFTGREREKNKTKADGGRDEIQEGEIRNVSVDLK